MFRTIDEAFIIFFKDIELFAQHLKKSQERAFKKFIRNITKIEVPTNWLQMSTEKK